MPHILVLNPNSSRAITAAIDDALAPLRARTRYRISCTELAAAPEGIESDADVAQVAPMVRDLVRTTPAAAVVVACFSDPGVDLAHAVARDRPVIGIAAAAYGAALLLGARFGVISLGPASVTRHAAHLTRLGLISRLAGDRAVSMSVAEGARPESIDRIGETARRLRDEDGAEVIILGCAGMGRHRHNLQQMLALPVIDPVQAAVAAAIGQLDLEYYPTRQITGA